MAIQITRTVSEVAGVGAPNIRVARTSAEVAGVGAPNIRVTRTSAEVAGVPTQPDLRLYRVALYALVQEDAGISETVSQTLTFTQSQVLSFPIAGESNSLFTQSVVLGVESQKTVSQTLTFTQDAVAQPSDNLLTENSLTFSQLATPSLYTQPIASALLFTQQASSVGEIELSVTQQALFTQNLTGITPFSQSHTLSFSQASTGVAIIPGGLVRVASSDLLFTQSVAKVLILASATSHDGENDLLFSQHASLPQFLIVTEGAIFTDLSVSDYVNSVTHGLSFTHSFSDIFVSPKTVAHSLLFTQAFVAENKIILCQYSPIGLLPAKPTIVKATQVTLFYPTTSPTLTVIIRTPEYGDRHRLQFDRINRESRGGNLEIFADPTWPKLESLEASFTGLKESEAQAVLSFFKETLGLEIGFTDWYGKTWHGVIVSPDTQVIRARRGIVDLSFEFEGEVQ